MKRAAEQLLMALDIRNSYQNQSKGSGEEGEGPKVPSGTPYEMVDGVVCFEGETTTAISYTQYAEEFGKVCGAVEDGPTKSVCRNRLKILDEKYAIYIALNSELEENQCPMRKGGGVFSSCVKVDNSVRLSTAMHAHQLLDYMVQTYETQPDTIVGQKEGKPVRLRDVYEKYGITNPRALTVEGVGLHPPVQKRFHRFDVFSKDFNRGGERSAELLKLYLKREGPFYHNLVKPIMERTEKEFPTRRVTTEYKLPIFGTSMNEWSSLATWVMTNGLGNFARNRWVIQIPRIAALRSTYSVASTQEQLDNIFLPMWDASVNPDKEENKMVAQLLNEVGAINVIGDESARQNLPKYRPPAEWAWSENPPDLYFNYYVWANIVKLNHLRRRNGLNTFGFRPNCGEAGNVDQLVMGFMLAQSINHGITMERSTVLQYLFYLSQTGIILSPLMSNGLGNPEYRENPFNKYQKRGMRVSLGTEDPLHYHHSTHPCIEEYGTASKIYKLGPVDMAEIARNSVLTSSYSHKLKKEWLGDDFDNENQSLGNDHNRSLVPDVRLCFRDDTLIHERQVIHDALHLDSGGTSQPPESRKPSIAPSRHHSLRSMSASSVGKALGVTEEGIAFPRVDIISPVNDVADEPVAKAVARAATLLAEVTALRSKYINPNTELESFLNLGKRALSDVDEFKADMDWECIPKKGVYMYKRKSSKADIFEPSDLCGLDEFWRDFNKVHDVVENIYVKAMCHRRLQVLEHKFALHMALNIQLENAADESGQSRDFYQAPKVDTHIHAAAGMTARQLLEFILKKAQDGLDDVVKVDKEKNPVTLRQLFKSMGIHPEDLTVHTLNVQADATLFERFDNFNNKYNPMGNPDLRSLLLKTDNYMGGRYFAEIAKSTFAQFSRDEYTYAEMRLSIYGRNIKEWANLAAWFDTHGMASTHNKWMVQVPRIYSLFRQSSVISSFQELLTNIFEPLWKVSLNPASDPKLHHFLKHMSGFDSVDNESQPDSAFPHDTYPSEWTSRDNPPYGYWMYFMWANLHSLNTFRASRGLCTFTFRPHCGESGSPDHLMHAHLTAHQINHGVNLRRDPVLEYLYYITQMGIAVSPLSNNSLFLDILKNPFPLFFRRGLNVSLSTDDPLQFHYTQEPLIEEYSIASKVWKLNANDMCEIARNSVIQSGFHVGVKSQLVGEKYLLSSSSGNDARKTHLSNIRVAYRFEAYHAEIESMEEAAGNPIFDGLRAKFTISQEVALLAEKSHRRKTSLKTELPQNAEEISLCKDKDLTRELIQKLCGENEELKDKVQLLKEENERLSRKRGSLSTPRSTALVLPEASRRVQPPGQERQLPPTVLHRPLAGVKPLELSGALDYSMLQLHPNSGSPEVAVQTIEVAPVQESSAILPHVHPHPPPQMAALSWHAPASNLIKHSPEAYAQTCPAVANPRPSTGHYLSRRIGDHNSFATVLAGTTGKHHHSHHSKSNRNRIPHSARTISPVGPQQFSQGKVPPPPPPRP